MTFCYILPNRSSEQKHSFCIQSWVVQLSYFSSVTVYTNKFNLDITLYVSILLLSVLNIQAELNTEHSSHTDKYSNSRIYQIKCLNSLLKYIWQTGWTFNVRHKQQIHGIRNNNGNSATHMVEKYYIYKICRACETPEQMAFAQPQLQQIGDQWDM
jgi:hypothetical protein